MSGFWNGFFHALLFLPKLAFHIASTMATADMPIYLGIFTITIMVILNVLGVSGESNLPMTSKISLIGLLLIGVPGLCYKPHGLLLYVLVPFILVCISIGLGHARNMTFGQTMISILMSPLLFVRYILTL